MLVLNKGKKQVLSACFYYLCICKSKKMVRLFLITLPIIAAGMVLMSVTILIKRGGRFPNTHVCGNRHLRRRGISSAQTQDRQARRENRMAVKERSGRTGDSD